MCTQNHREEGRDILLTLSRVGGPGSTSVTRTRLISPGLGCGTRQGRALQARCLGVHPVPGEGWSPWSGKAEPNPSSTHSLSPVLPSHISWAGRQLWLRARPRQHAALHGTRLSGKGRPSQLCWQGEGGTGHCRKTLPLLQIFTRGAPWVWQEGACFPPPSSSILPGTPCRTPRFPGPVLPVVTGHCNSRETPWWDELQAPLTPQLAALSHLPLPSLAGSCCTLTWALPSLLVGPLSSHSLLDEGGKQSLCLSPCWRFFLAALSPPPGGCSSVGGSAAGLGVL